MFDGAIEHVFAGIAITDYQASLEWYETLFGRAPDVVVVEGREAMWQLADKAWLYIVRDADRAGKSLFTILVSDLEASLSALRTRGMELPEIETEPGKFRRAVMIDPDGNTIAFGQSFSTT